MTMKIHAVQKNSAKMDTSLLKLIYMIGKIFFMFPWTTETQKLWNIIQDIFVILLVVIGAQSSKIILIERNIERTEKSFILISHMQGIFFALSILYGLLSRRLEWKQLLFHMYNSERNIQKISIFRKFQYLIFIAINISSFILNGIRAYRDYSEIVPSTFVFISVIQLTLVVAFISEVIYIFGIRQNYLYDEIQSLKLTNREAVLKNVNSIKYMYREMFYAVKQINGIFGIWFWCILAVTFLEYMADFNLLLSYFLSNSDASANLPGRTNECVYFITIYSVS